MAPKTLYYVPQAFIMSVNNAKVEFCGVVSFAEKQDNNQMFLTITGPGGIFKGNLGHPKPSKISDDQVAFYMNVMNQNPDIQNCDQAVQDKVKNGMIWGFEELKEYIEKVRVCTTDKVERSKQDKNKEGNHGVLEVNLLKQLEGKDGEIKKVKEASLAEITSLHANIKEMLDIGKSNQKEIRENSKNIKEMLDIGKSNQKEILENSKKIEIVTEHVEHIADRKGKFQAFLSCLKAPLSIQVDKHSLQVTVLGSEQVISALGSQGGAFGEDIVKLCSDGTVQTMTLVSSTPRDIAMYFVAQEQPSYGPPAKSSVIIFLDNIVVPENTNNKGAVKFMGTNMKTDLGTTIDQAKKHHSKVILVFPPVSPDQINDVMEILHPTLESPDIIAINLTDISKPGSDGDGIEPEEAMECPINGPGWDVASVANAIVKAVEVLEPTGLVKQCASCWGSHFGPCAAAPMEVTTREVVKINDQTEDLQEVCLRCMNRHYGFCKLGLRTCTHCGEKGHSYRTHEVTDSSVQEEIKANFSFEFEFVQPGQARKRHNPAGKPGQQYQTRGAVGNKMKDTTSNNKQQPPIITAMMKK